MHFSPSSNLGLEFSSLERIFFHKESQISMKAFDYFRVIFFTSSFSSLLAFKKSLGFEVSLSMSFSSYLLTE